MPSATFDTDNTTFIMYDDPIFSLKRAIEKRRGAAKSPWIRTISARLKHSDSPTQSLCTAYMIDRVAMAAQDIFADIEEANDRYTHIERIVMDPFFNEACGNPIVVINELYVSAEHRQEKVGTNLVDYLCTRVKEVTGLDMEVFVAPRSLDREIDRMAREEAGLDIDEDAIDNLKKAQVDIAMAFWRNIGFVQAIPESAYSVRLLN